MNWLRFLRGAVLRKLAGLNDEQAHWRPDGALISLLGIVNHLTRVEWRWIDGGMLGHPTSRTEAEFSPGPELTVADAAATYRRRAEATDLVIRDMPLETPCGMQPGTPDTLTRCASYSMASPASDITAEAGASPEGWSDG